MQGHFIIPRNKHSSNKIRAIKSTITDKERDRVTTERREFAGKEQQLGETENLPEPRPAGEAKEPL